MSVIKERVYQGVIIAMFVILMYVICVSDRNFTELLEVNEHTYQLLVEQERRNQELIDEWEEAYSELNNKYEATVVENEVPISKSSACDFTEEEIYLLAQCARAEAGSYERASTSQRYVVQVILNRVQSDNFPDNIHDVIYQKTSKGVPQFSVAYNGMLESAEVTEETLENVRSVLESGTDLPYYICYFYGDYVTNSWVNNNLSVYDTVEGTVFAYSEEDY